VNSHSRSEGLSAARLMMVLSSVSPLFLLWAIRGAPAVDDNYFIPSMVVLIVIPNLVLWLRIRAAKGNREKRELIVGTSEDHREHLLVYLFAMLLPFYVDPLGTDRALVSTIAAVSFVIFLFWHLNLHYMNIIFAISGYRVFTVYPPSDGNDVSGVEPLVVITRRASLPNGLRMNAYRVSDTVYFEGA